MCQLFGFTSKNECVLNTELTEFFSRSKVHSDGWGVALYSNSKLFLFKKEPIEANKSEACKELLKQEIKANVVIGHIRKASVGNLSKANTHPFKISPENDWILAHNGTVKSDNWNLSKYKPLGNTDSEKIYVTLINDLSEKTIKTELDMYKSIQETLEKFSSKGKLNLLFTDGEKLFVYSNLKDKIHYLKKDDAYIFCTQPLGNDSNWMPLPIDNLFVFRDGHNVYQKESKEIRA